MNVNDLILRATQAANTAGDEWMKNAKVRFAVMDGEQVVGQLLDVCGNAHVRFTDKRTKEYKAFKNAGHTSITNVLYIPHKYKHRQEYGLHMACIEAAIKVLREEGVTKLRVWSYID